MFSSLGKARDGDRRSGCYTRSVLVAWGIIPAYGPWVTFISITWELQTPDCAVNVTI